MPRMDGLLLALAAPIVPYTSEILVFLWKRRKSPRSGQDLYKFNRVRVAVGMGILTSFAAAYSVRFADTAIGQYVSDLLILFLIPIAIAAITFQEELGEALSLHQTASSIPGLFVTTATAVACLAGAAPPPPRTAPSEPPAAPSARPPNSPVPPLQSALGQAAPEATSDQAAIDRPDTPPPSEIRTAGYSTDPIYGVPVAPTRSPAPQDPLPSLRQSQGAQVAQNIPQSGYRFTSGNLSATDEAQTQSNKVRNDVSNAISQAGEEIDATGIYDLTPPPIGSVIQTIHGPRLVTPMDVGQPIDPSSILPNDMVPRFERPSFPTGAPPLPVFRPPSIK